MTRRTLALLALAIVGAVVLQLADTRLAASQSTLLYARVAPSVPTDDPWDDVWSRSNVVDLPLSAQFIVAPKGGTRDRVKARALHDSERIYVLLEWRDVAADTAIGTVTAYSDAVALQFPAASATEVPALCMGSPAAIVNIWQWKAAWQEDARTDFTRIASSYPRASVDAYPFREDPVYAPARELGNLVAARARSSTGENLHAGQYSTLTTASTQPVGGIGVWRAGTWRVLFARAFVSGEEGDARFALGDSIDAAAAVWDGGVAERDGLKAVSAFFAIRVTSLPLAEPRLEMFPWLLLWPIATAVLLGGLALLGRARRPAR